MLNIISNQSLVGRRENIKGIDYAIYPVVLMVEGVHHAVNGQPVYYSIEALQNSVLHWEGRPVPVKHPNINGTYVRANDPSIEADWVVGRIYNTKVEDGKLKGEAWLEVAKTEILSPGLIMALDGGAQMEVSTGIMVEGDGVEGVWNQEPFTQSIIQIIPDHLALLPGETGACSWKDGCGIRANKNNIDESHNYELTSNINKINIRAQGDRDMNQLAFAINQLNTLTEEPEQLGLLADMAFEFLDLKKAPVSFTEMENQVRLAVRSLSVPSSDSLLTPSQSTYFYTREVYEDSVIYEKEDTTGIKLYKRSYTRNADGTISLLDDVIEVREQREFVPVNNQSQGENQMADTKPCCPEKVSAIISNENTAFTEADHEFLTNLSEDQLEKIYTTMINAFKSKKQMDEGEAKKMAEEEAKKKTPKANTAAEYVSSAPPEIAALLNAGLAQLEAKKSELISTITANARNKFSADQLKGMEVPQLEAIAALASPIDFSVNAGGGSGSAAPTAEEPYVNTTSLFEKK